MKHLRNKRVVFNFVLAFFVIATIVLTITVCTKENSVAKVALTNTKNVSIDKSDTSYKSALAFQQALRNIAKSVSPSVVNIRTEKVIKAGGNNRYFKRFKRNPFFDFFNDDDLFKRFSSPKKYKQQALGSGFIISKDGYIITNNHVVDSATTIFIYLGDSEKEYKAKLIGKDKLTDIALLKIEAKDDLPFVSLGDSSEVEVGDLAVAIGNPFGLKGTFTFGVISYNGRTSGLGPQDQGGIFKNYIQTDAPINQGNSGGPLLNIEGQVIGVNTAIFSTSGGSIGIGFAVPINVVKNVVEQLMKTGKVERGFIGIAIKDLDDKNRKYFNLDDDEGIFVEKVYNNGPADKAGLTAGDVILRVDNKKIKNTTDLIRVISAKKIGSVVKLLVIRKNSKKMTLKVKITSRPSKDINDNVFSNGNDNDGNNNSDNNAPKQKWLGMSFLERDNNVYVVDVKEESPADNAGIKKGDIILEIDYNKISGLTKLNEYIKASSGKNKKMFMMRIKRNLSTGSSITLFVTVEK